MKAVNFALMVLFVLFLSACTTLNPMQATATVYPVLDPAPLVVVDVAVEPLPEPAPVAPAVNPLDALIAQVSESELHCMALAIYHEARGEPVRGQAAVGWVVMNRLKHSWYPKTICGIVKQKIGRTCQFSWYCDGRSDTPTELDSYEKARQLALMVIIGKTPNPVGNAIFFDGYVHNTRPKAGHRQIGGHRFYARYASRG